MEPDAWSVLVDLEGPADANLDPDDPRLADLFDDLYTRHGAAMAAGGNDVSVRLTVERDAGVTTPEAAAWRGRQIVTDAMTVAGLGPALAKICRPWVGSSQREGDRG